MEPHGAKQFVTFMNGTTAPERAAELNQAVAGFVDTYGFRPKVIVLYRHTEPEIWPYLTYNQNSRLPPIETRWHTDNDNPNKVILSDSDNGEWFRPT
jgi:hypothetical protein